MTAEEWDAFERVRPKDDGRCGWCGLRLNGQGFRLDWCDCNKPFAAALKYAQEQQQKRAKPRRKK